MIFNNPPKLPSSSLIIRYLTVDLWNWFRNLTVGLVNLNFLENFSSFEVRDITIPAGQEIVITNNSGYIPRYRLIVRESTASTVVDGDTAWSLSFVSLKNVGMQDVTVTVIFFR